MPRNGSGTYTLAKPPFLPGTTISSADVNSDFTDIATALTASIAADGQTPITAPMKFTAGTAAAPPITFTSETTTGIYFPATGKVGVATLGVASVFIDGNRVGVGQDGAQLVYANTAIPSPVGKITDFAGSTAPAGWLLCYGQNVSRTGYPELFQVISTAFGTGDGSTTYGLPDYRGRVGAGKDNMGGVAANRVTAAASGITGTTLGAVGGTETHVLVSDEMPVHSHYIGVDTEDQSNDHHHDYTRFDAQNGTAAGGNPPGGSTSTQSTSGQSDSHHHFIDDDTDQAGDDADHLNMQPTIIINKIIFAGRP